MRLDLFLKENRNIQSRSRSKLLIEEGFVKVNNEVISDVSYKVKDNDIVEVEDFKYVSRGGYKLEYAINKINNEIFTSEEDNQLQIHLLGKNALDIGSSTGGFTDYLLQNGVNQVYAVDVGTDQFDPNLLNRNKDKIILLEKTDIRDVQILEPSGLTKEFDLIVCDASFISLKLILPSVYRYLKVGGQTILLVKPQFEVGKGNTDKGIVKDVNLRRDSLHNIVAEMESMGFDVLANFESGVIGGGGNIEYIVYARLNRK